LLFVVSASAVLGAACNPKIEELSKTRSPRDSLGQEIYKTLCRRVAGTEMPGDIDGRKTETLCLGDPEAAAQELEAHRDAYPARLVALADRRALVASALDESFPGESAGALEDLMGELLPFYDGPGYEAQEGTRRMAAVLHTLAKDDVALEGMERFAREGMIPSEGDFGLMRAFLSYREISPFLAQVLPAMLEEPSIADPLRETLGGMALELATNEIETEASSNTCRSRDLMLRTEQLPAGESAHFGTGKPLYSTLRDVRGLPIPTRDAAASSRDVLSACGASQGQVRAVPYPFVDSDADGFADNDGPNLSVDPSFSGGLPEPYAVTGEVEGSVARDSYGRAHAFTADGGTDSSKQLYLSKDVDVTVMAASLREAARLFSGGSSLLTHVAGAAPALLGDEVDTVRRYEKATHTFKAADPSTSPLIGLLHASSATAEDSSYDESLELSLKMLRDQERAMVSSIEPVLALEKRTRPENDAYPKAELAPNNTFWEELVWEVEKLSRRRNVKGGDTLLEAAARASLGFGRNFDKQDDKGNAPMETLIDPQLLAKQGSLLAMMMRYKDEWRGNPVAASKRAPGEPAIIGSLKQPVDRNAAETPITCGLHGCGGAIDGSPFERWRQPGQTCMVQIPGFGPQFRDCGAPANQSLFHRSMGMLAELEGRAQCNRPITVQDLFSFAGGADVEENPELQGTINEAEEALARDYTCPASAPADAPCRAYAAKYPAAFVERSDDQGKALPVAIQECGLLDLKDAGRIFGLVMTHEYRIKVPNPWVYRYLEDVARAADSSLPTCPAFSIVDPLLTPSCIPDAAKLSRGVFEELTSCAPGSADCIDTLGELIEFLLDDKELFQSERDLRELRPDARTLSRVMFTPAGASEGFQMFDPLLVRGAPPICKASESKRVRCHPSTKTDDPTCCIGDVTKPPMRFRVDTYYGATTYAWEHTFKLLGGQALSFLDATKPVADAFNRFDIPEGANPADYEDTGYVLTKLGAIVAAHYDSPRNTEAQNKNPNIAGYSKLTGLVRYEELLADLFDDGSMDMKQKAPHGAGMFADNLSFPPEQQLGMLAKGTDLLLAMDALSFRDPGGKNPDQDGIRSFTRSLEAMANPHAFCAGEGGDSRVVGGRGACDASTRARRPVATLDGRDYPCWDDGRCFDGKTPATPRRYVSALSLTLDSAAAFYDRAKSVPGMYESARAVLSTLLDALAPIENGVLQRRRVRSLGLVIGEYAREQWAEEKAAGTLSTLGKRGTDDMIDVITNPGFAGGLHVLRALREQQGVLDAISKLLFTVLDESSEPAASRAFLAASADALQTLPGDAGSNALLRNVALGLAPNLEDVMSGKEKSLDIDGSLAWNNVFMLGETAKPDKHDVLGTILGAMMRARGPQFGAPGTVPGSDLMDTLLDINRFDASESGQHRARDFSAAFTRMADVMLDTRSGFERLYSMVRCSRQASKAKKDKDPDCL
jgi:hypothetical protein